MYLRGCCEYAVVAHKTFQIGGFVWNRLVLLFLKLIKINNKNIF